MQRRALLCTLGSTVLTGCQIGLDAPESDPSTGRGKSPECAALGEQIGDGISVSNASVQTSVRRRTTPDSYDIYAPADTQFLFVEVDAAGLTTPPPISAFSLHLDERSFDPAVELDGVGIRSLVHGTPAYNPPSATESRSSGFLVFALPMGHEPVEGWIAVESERDEVPSARWVFTDRELAAVAPPYPDLELVSLDVPRTVSEDRLPLGMVIRNTGGASGVFRAAINHMGPFYAAEAWDIPVAAGETTEDAHAISYDWGSSGEVRFKVVWPDGGRIETVQVNG
ncbi:MAG: hypothetical protein ABEH64_12140 [Salinirussus sp.]